MPKDFTPTRTQLVRPHDDAGEKKPPGTVLTLPRWQADWLFRRGTLVFLPDDSGFEEGMPPDLERPKTTPTPRFPRRLR